MGNYADLDDLRTMLPENVIIRLTDVNSLGEVNATVAEAYFAETDGDLDGYISRRRSVPVTPVPDKLKYLAIRWWFYVAHRYRQSVSEDIETDHRRDVEWLEAYAAGEGSLGDDADPGAQTSGDAEAEYNERVYTRAKLAGW